MPEPGTPRTTTDALIKAATDTLEEHRAMINGVPTLRAVTVVFQIRRDGIKTLFRPEYERER